VTTASARGRRWRASLRLATPDEVEPYLRDAAGTPGGHTRLVLLARREAEVAAALRASRAVLPVGAQTSLTGGATPIGHTVLSLARMDQIGALSGDEIELQAGVALLSLDARQQPRPLPIPVPTYHGARSSAGPPHQRRRRHHLQVRLDRDWVRA
jgi:D-lactate dehydrogenase (cytochrome)